MGMANLEIVLSFLSGGLVVKLLDWIQFSEGVRAQQRIEFLKQQVSDLYGPLYLLARQNLQLFELSTNIDAAYTAEYCDKNWSDDESTRKSISEEAKTTIEVKNRYTSLLIANTKAMCDVIRNCLWMSEADDRPHFETIIQDVTRIETELDGELRGALPFRIETALENIAFARDDVLKYLVAKYKAKREALDKASRSRWPWRSPSAGTRPRGA